jgi:TRAP transporter TAXI family solute receptor
MADTPISTDTPQPPRRRLRAIVRKPVDGGRMQFDKEALKDLLFIVGLPLAALIAAFWFAGRYVQPAPPSTFVMTTGPSGGAYHLFAQRYRDILKRDKITMVLKPSAGSIENIQRLQDAQSNVEVGLVQAGMISGEPPPGLRSLGAVYYEPMWVFYQGKEDIDKLSQLSGKRIAIGPEGSGTRALALQLLKASGADSAPTKLEPLGGNSAVKALLDGSVDAALLVAAPDAPTIHALASAKNIKLVSLVQADAFTRRFPYLTAMQLPRGAVDLAADLPSRNVTLLTATANLIVREDFHPALGFLLLRAATEVHGRAGMLQKLGEFPAARESDFPLAEEAQRYYKSGTPFLYRYLPFWLANLMERMAVLLLPLVAVLLPLFRILPALIQWRNKSRLFKWYGELKHLESRISVSADGAQLDGYLERLDEIEEAVNNTRVGSTYVDYVYNLRLHIDMVRNRVHRIEEQSRNG